MIVEVRDIQELKKFYALYSARAKDMYESEEEFLNYVKMGKVLRDDKFIALFVPCKEFCFVFYLATLNGCNKYVRKDIYEYFCATFDLIELPLIGIRKNELWYFDKQIFLVYDIEKQKIKIRRWLDRWVQ